MDLKFYLVRQRLWFLKIFGPGRRDAGLIKHIKKELDEIKASPGDLEEWIDVVILALEGAIRNAEAVSDRPVDDVVDCLLMKQEKNINREWPDWKAMDPSQPIEHVK
jgi:hypothetical protein